MKTAIGFIALIGALVSGAAFAEDAAIAEYCRHGKFNTPPSEKAVQECIAAIKPGSQEEKRAHRYAEQRAKLKHEQGARDVEEAKAEAEKKTKCGSDYHKLRVGMKIQRLSECGIAAPVPVKKITDKDGETWVFKYLKLRLVVNRQTGEITKIIQ